MLYTYIHIYSLVIVAVAMNQHRYCTIIIIYRNESTFSHVCVCVCRVNYTSCLYCNCREITKRIAMRLTNLMPLPSPLSVALPLAPTPPPIYCSNRTWSTPGMGLVYTPSGESALSTYILPILSCSLSFRFRHFKATSPPFGAYVYYFLLPPFIIVGYRLDSGCY